MNNLKSYFVFLSRNKLYTLVNVFGLSVSMMFVIVIASYVAGEYSVDKQHKKLDQIEILCTPYSAFNAYRVGEKLAARYPEIEKVCGYIPAQYGASIAVEVQDKNLLAKVICVDSTFLEIFDFELIQGNRNAALRAQNEVIISNNFAHKVCGKNSPIGETIRIADRDYTIVGVVEDFKNSVFPQTDVIMTIGNMKYFNPSTISEECSNAGSAALFFQMTKGSDMNAKSEEVVEFFKTFYWYYINGVESKTQFVPLDEFYFKKEIGSSGMLNRGDPMMLMVLVAVGALILLFAVFNYINLTVAQTGFRAKEMATRRLYGLSYVGVLLKMMGESVFMALIAMLLGLLMAFSAIDYVTEIIGKTIYLFESITPLVILGGLLFTIILGALSGIIPAVVITKFKPIDVVKGSFAFKSKMRYSRIFIVIQSVITIALIGCSFTMYKQVGHLINYDYGYNHTAILNIPYEAYGDEYEILREELLKLPQVKNVGFTCGTPLDGGNNNTIYVEGIEGMIGFQIIYCDTVTMKIFGVQILKDNNIKTDNSPYINEEAVKRLEADNDIKYFAMKDSPDRRYEVRGIFKNIYLRDITHSTGLYPMLIYVTSDIRPPWSILVEVRGDLTEARRAVQKVHSETIEGLELTAKYIDEDIEEAYTVQRRMQSIMVLFTIIAMIISALGLLAMSSYFIQQRAKEVAIRKVFGATKKEVLIQIIWKYLKLVVIAFVIAAPIIWYVMNQWLEGFAYRVDVSLWIIIGAGLLNLLIAFVTVYWQGNTVANTNPTKSMQK